MGVHPSSRSLCAAGCVVVVMGLAALAHLKGREGEREGSMRAEVAEPRKRAAPTVRSAAALRDGRPIDLNNATSADLELLPGIGPALARRIVEKREHGGPFSRVDELLDVSGIGPRVLARIRPFVSVAKAVPSRPSKTSQKR